MDGPEALGIDSSICWDAYIDMNDENFLRDIDPNFRLCRSRARGTGDDAARGHGPTARCNVPGRRPLPGAPRWPLGLFMLLQGL